MIIRPLAIHLPQFHPIPENDEWWGKGFTEWTNVSKAQPFFTGHLQPRIPTEFGYYDLRLFETLLQQSIKAKETGFEGFAFYHYWFEGKRLLQKPTELILQNKTYTFPFCFIWANETWSRRWLGEEAEILMKQTYSAEDDEQHANYLISFFKDDRYIKVNGRPVFTIYRPGSMPNAKNTLAIFERVCLQNDLPKPYFIAGSPHTPDHEKFLKEGFDAVMNFRPQLGVVPQAFNDQFSFKRTCYNFYKHGLLNGELKLYLQEDAYRLMEKAEPETFDKVAPVVFVGWDNTPRRGKKGIIFKKQSPQLFKKELERVIQKQLRAKDTAPFFFVNAWNEWAEGNYLEPDLNSGDAYLQACKSVFNNLISR